MSFTLETSSLRINLLKLKLHGDVIDSKITSHNYHGNER